MCFRLLSFLLLIVLTSDLSAQEVALPGLREPVRVYLDAHGVPHIYAKSDLDAARVLGYLHARDRLGQMDLARRRASGTSAEVFGKDALASDIFVRQLGLRRNCKALWKSADFPASLRNEVLAYTAGVNANIQERSPDRLPPIFKTLGYVPSPWSPVDCLVFTKYMAWDQSGTDDDLWFGIMVEKLGVAAVEELWPLDRPYEIPTVKVQADRRRLSRGRLRPIPHMADTYARAMHTFAAVPRSADGINFGSNNWAVDGSKTRSGKPILCADPHLGFRLPAIWYTCHVSVNGVNRAGVTFPGAPTIVIGHNDYLAWGITNMQADAVDFFVETIHPDDPRQYKHRGAWKKLRRITERVPIKGDQPYILHIDYSVHGPLIYRDNKTLAMQWTGLGVTKEFIAFWKLGRARTLREFLAALDLVSAPAMNIAYADVHGTIAMHPCGALPLRTAGQGRIPMDGASGDFDWTGMIPRDQLPLAINPPDHFVASANGRPASIGYPHYLGWMWDPSYRTRRIHELLHDAKDLTVEKMITIQNDVHDKAAEVFLPVFLAALTDEDVTDGFSKKMRDRLAAWDYVADRDAVGPVIWLRWFDLYRKAVWNDEWKDRNVKQPGGSWGFTGNNHREPMLEVLEFITRNHPNSIWFDDRTTPNRESRNDILRRTFAQTVSSLQKQFSKDLSDWTWSKINILRIGPLSQRPEDARIGSPVPGTPFTVNPGSNIGYVGGGASWRMIVNLAAPQTSVGVYPGGQSEDPTSPHYDDQIPLWARGKYLPLHAISEAGALPPAAKTETLVFNP